MSELQTMRELRVYFFYFIVYTLFDKVYTKFPSNIYDIYYLEVRDEIFNFI